MEWGHFLSGKPAVSLKRGKIGSSHRLYYVVLYCVVLYCAAHSFFLSLISGMHHYECVAPNIDINLQSGQFSATPIASFRERFIDFRSCWVVFIHVVRGSPGGLLQFCKGKLLRSAWHLIRLTFMPWGRRGETDTMLEQQLKDVVALFSISCHMAYHLIPSRSCRHRRSKALILGTSVLVTARHLEDG